MSRIGLVLMAALAPLTLVSGYLVDPPTTAPDDTIKDCSNWVVAGKSDTCDSLAESGGITLDELYLYVSFIPKSPSSLICCPSLMMYLLSRTHLSKKMAARSRKSSPTASSRTSGSRR